MMLKEMKQTEEPEEVLFHFVHTTNQASFHQRSLRAVESVFFHHPNATVYVHVPDDGETIGLKSDMTEMPFVPLINAGYNVTVQRFKLRTLIDAAIAQEGSTIDKNLADSWMRTQIMPNLMKWNWYVDISDLVRLLLVYTHGGLYMDTDVIVVNPLDNLPNSIGFVRPGGPGSGVLKFNKGNQYLADCINEYFSNFRTNNDAWGFVGPKLLKRIWLTKYRNCQLPEAPTDYRASGWRFDPAHDDQSCPFHILWDDVYYPNVDNCFVQTPNTKKKQRHIQEHTFIAHTYNQRTKWALEKMNITKMKTEDTLCNWLYSSFCIFCDGDVWKL